MNAVTTRDVIRQVFNRYRMRILAYGVPEAALSEERIRRLAQRTVPRIGRGEIGLAVQDIAKAIKRYIRWHHQRA